MRQTPARAARTRRDNSPARGWLRVLVIALTLWTTLSVAEARGAGAGATMVLCTADGLVAVPLDGTAPAGRHICPDGLWAFAPALPAPAVAHRIAVAAFRPAPASRPRRPAARPVRARARAPPRPLLIPTPSHIRSQPCPVSSPRRWRLSSR